MFILLTRHRVSLFSCSGSFSLSCYSTLLIVFGFVLGMPIPPVIDILSFLSISKNEGKYTHHLLRATSFAANNSLSAASVCAAGIQSSQDFPPVVRWILACIPNICSSIHGNNMGIFSGRFPSLGFTDVLLLLLLWSKEFILPSSRAGKLKNWRCFLLWS